jgi:hypothetical protein
MHCCLRVTLALLAGAALHATEPFSLQLTGLGGYWFPSGAVIRVPNDVCGELQVRLGLPSANYIDASELKLKFDRAYPLPRRLKSSEGQILVVKAREPVGLLTAPEHRVEVETTGAEPLRGQWTILHWDLGYMQAVIAGQDGSPIQINLAQPNGVILAPANPQAAVRFRGEVLGGDSVRLIAGQTRISRDPSQPGFHFDLPIAIPAGAAEFAVRAEDDFGNSTTIVLRVVRSSN